MYSRIFLLAISASALLMGSCKKDLGEDYILVNNNNNNNNNNVSNISFDSPQEGQINEYVLFRGEDIRDASNNEYSYLGDTLVIELLDENENGWLVKENLKAGSASLNGELNVAYADSTWYYYLNFESDKIKISPRGDFNRCRLFFMDREESLPMYLNTESIVQMRGWKTNIPFDENYFMAKLIGYEQLGGRYDELNVVIDNRAMANDLPGHMHIYSGKDGLVKSAQYSDLTNKGFGWDLLTK